jgi:hypothetical protein
MQVSAAFDLDAIPALSIPERILPFVASDTDRRAHPARFSPKNFQGSEQRVRLA